jgi:hypothetical protein
LSHSLQDTSGITPLSGRVIMRTSSAARQFVACAHLAAMLIVILPALAAAQEPTKSFEQLGGVLDVGDKVRVTDTENREVSGKITALDAKSITLDTAGGTTLSAERVRRVERLKRSKGYGCLVGIGAGAVGGLVFAASAETGEEATGGYLLPGIGAGVGTLVGAFMTRSHEVYRAPSTSGSARLSITPVITPRTKGVAVAFTF